MGMTRPRAADRREVARLRNELAATLNHAHEILSRLGREIGIADRIEDVADEISHRKSVLVAQEREAHAPTWGNDDADF
jgi:hypothetical protein